MTSDCCERIPQDKKNLFLRKKDISFLLHTREFHFQIYPITLFPLVVDNCADTKTCKFNCIQWHIQIYNNGLNINDSEGWINFIVLRGGAHIPEKNVLLTFGILDREGVEHYRTEYTFKMYDLVSEPIKLLPESEACSKENKFLQNDYVEIRCTMHLKEPVQELDIPFNAPSDETIGRLVVEKRNKLSESVSFEIPQPSSAMQAAGGSNIPEKDVYTTKHVTWMLPCYEEMCPTLGYNVVSPEFKFFGQTYRMRIYTLGWSAYASYRGIAVVLEKSKSDVQREVTCEFSSNYKNDRSETHCLEKHVDVLGPINLVFDSETPNFKNMPLEIFCHMMAKGFYNSTCEGFEPNTGEGFIYI